MMTMYARNQYLHTLISQRGGYHLKNKKAKSLILDEYCQLTGQNRKAVSAKIKSGRYVKTLRYETGQKQRQRSSPYNNEVAAYLIKLWEIFDRPCGQRLAPLIRRELDRLQHFGEITISKEMSIKLKTISPRTIDTKLKSHKEQEHLKRKYANIKHPLLYQKIPVKLAADQGRGIGESIQIDVVEHCGQSAKNPFICTVSATDIGSGWWEGEPLMSRSGWSVQQALGRIQYRFPFSWQEIHSDNGSEFINDLCWRWTQRQELRFSRSRPYAKNDNCFVEQKNSTHVRQIVGYHRYDTRAEGNVLKTLYRDDLRLFKNFFQPIMPLIAKERIGGHIKRKYGEPKTPYQRILEDKSIEQEVKDQLTNIYHTLNPAQLKRNIRKHQNLLYQTYCQKQHQLVQEPTLKVENLKKLTPHSATFLIAEPMRVGQHSLIA